MSAGRLRLRRHGHTGAALLGVGVLCASLVTAAATPPTPTAPHTTTAVTGKPLHPFVNSFHTNVAFTDDTDHLVTVAAPGSKPHPTGFGRGAKHEGEASDNGNNARQGVNTQAWVSTQDNPNGEVYISTESRSDSAGNAFPPVPVTCDDATKTHPVVSPSGTEIAYASNGNPDGDNPDHHFRIVVASPVPDTTPSSVPSGPTTPTVGIGARPRRPAAAVACSTIGYQYQTLPNQTGDNLWPTWVDDNTLIYSSTRDNPLGDLYKQSISPVTPTTPIRVTNGQTGNGNLVANTQPNFDPTHQAVYFTTTEFRADGSIGFVPLSETLPATPSNAWLDTFPPPQSSEADPGFMCVPNPDGQTCTDVIAYSSTVKDPFGGVYLANFTVRRDTLDPGSVRAIRDAPGVTESHPALLDWWADGEDPVFDGVVFTVRHNGAVISSVASDGSNRHDALISGNGSGTDNTTLDTSAPAYSPDGTKMAYSQTANTANEIEQGGAAARQIVVQNADGTQAVTRVTPWSDETGGSNQVDIDTDPAWSPDGSKLAFARTVLVDIGDGVLVPQSQHIMIADGPAFDDAHELAVPGSQAFFDGAPSWSPDGTRIVVSRVPEDADLAPEISANPNTISTVETTTITASVTNPEPWPVLGVVITVDLGQLSSGTLPHGCTQGTGDQVVCDIGRLAGSDQAQVAIPASSQDAGSFAVTATVSATTPDPDRSNNSSSADVQVEYVSGAAIAARPRTPREHVAVTPHSVTEAPPAQPSASGTRGVNLFGPSEPPQLWVFDANGTSNPVPLTLGSRQILGAQPAWSPDGRQIAYDSAGQVRLATLQTPTSNSVAADTALTGYATYARDDGSGTPPIGGTSTPQSAISAAHDPAWWPDGSKIAFSGQPAGQPDNLGIYTVNAADGAGLTPLAQAPEPESEPSVQTYADLSLMLAPPTQTILINSAANLTATVTNNGPGRAANPTLTFTLPSGLSAGALPASCTASATTITCTLPTIAANGSSAVTIQVLAGTATGSFDVNASVVSDTADPDPTNNTATATVVVRTRTVVPQADLSLAIALSRSTAQPGNFVTATITVHNAGPQQAVNAKLATTFDPRLSASASPSCAAGGTCSLGTLNAGDDVTFVVNLHPQQDGHPPHGYAANMTGNVSSDTQDPNTSNNTASATLPVGQPVSDVAVTVTVADVAFVGGHSAAHVTVVNHGPAVATDVHLRVTMPSQLTATAATPCAAGAGVCILGMLAPGGQRTFAITIVPHKLRPPRNYAVTISAHVTTTAVESTLANNTAKARLPVKQPTVQLLPPIGPPGFVTLAFGENLPPHALVTLDWKEGITSFDGPFRVAADGTVQAPMLVLRRDELGMRQLILRGPAGLFSAIQTNMLVVPRTESPPRFLGRD